MLKNLGLEEQELIVNAQDLIVEPNQVLTVSARLYQYNSVQVKKNGTIVIQ